MIASYYAKIKHPDWKETMRPIRSSIVNDCYMRPKTLLNQIACQYIK